MAESKPAFNRYDIRNSRGTLIARIDFIDELERPTWLSFLGRSFFWNTAGHFQELPDEPPRAI